MAVDFSGGESLLPSEFDDFTSEDQNWSSSESGFNGFGSCGSSDQSTSVGSELDSVGTESDDDGFMAELTRQMADYMLDEKEEEQQEDGEISNSKIEQNIMSSCIKSTGSVSHHNIHCNNYQRRDEQNIKHAAGSLIKGRREKTESNQRFGSRPNQQFHPIDVSKPTGSAMRAVFLNGPGSRNTCKGTGVFLPRGLGNPVALEPGKKTRCSTVLIPARVLQALEQHFNNVDTTSQSKDVIVGNGVYMQQKRQLDSQTRPTINYDKETQLPHEWTY